MKDIIQLASAAQIQAKLDEVTALRDEVLGLVGGIGTGKSAYQSALDTGFVGTEAQWVASLKGVAGAAAVLIGTSTTSLAIAASGSKTLTTQAGLSYAVGMPIRFASVSTPTTFMSGIVTAYNTTTGSLTITVDASNGSGTFASWNIVPSGTRGAAGLVDYDAVSNNVGIIIVKFTGTAWQTRASRVPAGFTGIVLFWSAGYTGVASPTDMTGSNDFWAREN